MKTRKESFLTVLLTAKSIREACEITKVPEATAYLWVNRDPEFKAAMSERLEAAAAVSFGKLKAIAEAATSTLESCVHSENQELAFRAASKVLDLICRFKELYEFDARLAALEKPSQSIKIGDKTIFF